MSKILLWNQHHVVYSWLYIIALICENIHLFKILSLLKMLFPYYMDTRFFNLLVSNKHQHNMFKSSDKWYESCYKFENFFPIMNNKIFIILNRLCTAIQNQHQKHFCLFQHMFSIVNQICIFGINYIYVDTFSPNPETCKYEPTQRNVTIFEGITFH